MSTHRFHLHVYLFLCVLCLSSCAVGPQGGDQAQFMGKSFSLIQQEIDKKKILPQKEFRGYLSLKTKGPVIPGIFQGAVPQGKAFIPEHDFFTLDNSMRVPVWHLDSTNLEHSITAPPMSEGIAVVGDKLAVLYESGADKYRRTARLPQDRIHLLDLDLLMELTSSSG